MIEVPNWEGLRSGRTATICGRIASTLDVTIAWIIWQGKIKRGAADAKKTVINAKVCVPDAYLCADREREGAREVVAAASDEGVVDVFVFIATDGVVACGWEDSGGGNGS